MGRLSPVDLENGTYELLGCSFNNANTVWHGNHQYLLDYSLDITPTGIYLIERGESDGENAVVRPIFTGRHMEVDERDRILRKFERAFRENKDNTQEDLGKLL